MNTVKCDCGRCRECRARQRYYAILQEANTLLKETVLKETDLPVEPRKPGHSTFARKLALYRAMNARRRVYKLRRKFIAAAQSKSYSTSRRSLTQTAVVAAKKQAGLKASEPRCNCQQCKQCKFYARRRAARDERRTSGFYWDQQQQEESPFYRELADVTRKAAAATAQSRPRPPR